MTVLYRGKQLSNISISKFWPIMICVFLGLSNFYGRDFELIIFSFLLFFVFWRGKFWINFSLFFLFLFACFSAIFAYDPTDSLLLLVRPFIYPLCYFLGRNIFIGDAQGKTLLIHEKCFVRTGIFLSAGMLFHFVLNMFSNRSSGGASRGELLDFWTGKYASATGQAALAVMMAGIAIAFLFSNVGKGKKVLSGAVLLLIVYYNLVLAGRTLYLLMALLILTAGVHYGIKKKRFLRVLLGCVLVYHVQGFSLY